MMQWWFNKKSNYPAFYKRYLERIQDEGWSKHILAFDMETSGIEVKSADILSFGSIPIIHGKILAKQEKHLFFHSSAHQKENILIHELFAHTYDKALDDYIEVIMDTLSNHVLLGHFVEFDIALVNRQLSKLKLPKLRNPSLDTLKMAMKKDGIHSFAYAKRTDYTLYTLCERFEIDVEFTHDALYDAYLTALLYLHLEDKSS